MSMINKIDYSINETTATCRYVTEDGDGIYIASPHNVSHCTSLLFYDVDNSRRCCPSAPVYNGFQLQAIWRPRCCDGFDLLSVPQLERQAVNHFWSDSSTSQILYWRYGKTPLEQLTDYISLHRGFMAEGTTYVANSSEAIDAGSREAFHCGISSVILLYCAYTLGLIDILHFYVDSIERLVNLQRVHSWFRENLDWAYPVSLIIQKDLGGSF